MHSSQKIIIFLFSFLSNKLDHVPTGRYQIIISICFDSSWLKRELLKALTKLSLQRHKARNQCSLVLLKNPFNNKIFLIDVSHWRRCLWNLPLRHFLSIEDSIVSHEVLNWWIKEWNQLLFTSQKKRRNHDGEHSGWVRRRRRRRQKEEPYKRISLAVYLSWRCAFNIKIQWWVSFRVGNNVVVIIIENIRRKGDEKAENGWNLHHWLCRFCSSSVRREKENSVDSGISIEATSGEWNFTFLLPHQIYLPTHSFLPAPFFISNDFWPWTDQ